MEKDELTEEELEQVTAGLPVEARKAKREEFMNRIKKEKNDELTEEELEYVTAGLPLEAIKAKIEDLKAKREELIKDNGQGNLELQEVERKIRLLKAIYGIEDDIKQDKTNEER